MRTKNIKGENNPNWKGGYPKCSNCGSSVSRRDALHCTKCRGLSISLERHPNWNGGLTETQKLEKKAGRLKLENCEICGGTGRICFDHDHTTNKFRGWLCVRCNLVLGMVKDNTDLLLEMANYLKQHHD